MVRTVRYDPSRYERQEQIRRSRSYTVRGYKRWIDPFPLGFGTQPEKIVYEQLSRRGIPFYYINDFQFSIPEISFMKEYQADFVLPDHKIIIEVQGAYWHSKPATIESDAFKFAVYQLTGWRVLAWWDYEILADINKLFRADSVLSAYSFTGVINSTELTPVSRKKADTSKGIRTLNTRRAQRIAYRKKPVTIKKQKTKGLKTYGIRSI